MCYQTSPSWLQHGHWVQHCSSSSTQTLMSLLTECEVLPSLSRAHAVPEERISTPSLRPDVSIRSGSRLRLMTAKASTMRGVGRDIVLAWHAVPRELPLLQHYMMNLGLYPRSIGTAPRLGRRRDFRNSFLTHLPPREGPLRSFNLYPTVRRRSSSDQACVYLGKELSKNYRHSVYLRLVGLVTPRQPD